MQEHPSIHSFLHSFTHSSIHTSMHSSILPSIHSFIPRSFIHSLIHSIIHPSIHSFDYKALWGPTRANSSITQINASHTKVCMQVAAAWQLHGRCMADAWQLHGKCMAVARQLHGSPTYAAMLKRGPGMACTRAMPVRKSASLIHPRPTTALSSIGRTTCKPGRTDSSVIRLQS